MLKRMSVVTAAAGVLLMWGGCGESRSQCKSIKAGVVTTVNHYCVVVNEDPVDPSVTAIAWKGQSIGLCCEGCRKGWDKMSDAEKDTAVARAIALGRPSK